MNETDETRNPGSGFTLIHDRSIKSTIHSEMPQKRSFKGFVMMALLATALTAYSQEAPSFLEPIDTLGLREKKALQLFHSALSNEHQERVEIGPAILWLYWRHANELHMLKLRKDKVYQRDLPLIPIPDPDPFAGPDVPYEEVFTLAFSKVLIVHIHELKGIDIKNIKTTQTSVSRDFTDRLIAVWNALTRTLQYRDSYPGGRGYNYEDYVFIAGINGPGPGGERIGCVVQPSNGPLFEFASLSMKLRRLVEPLPIEADPTTSKPQTGWSPELLQQEIIAACTLLEAKLKKRNIDTSLQER
jgi:hypothetical protein